MKTAIIEINHRKWLAGLIWRSFETRPGQPQIRSEGLDLDADCVVTRLSGEAIQAGFGAMPPEAESMRGLVSMAAAAADLKKEPWLGIYQVLADQWWFIAVRDGHAILPHGDAIGTRLEIEEAREKYSGFDDWNYVEGTAEDLAELLAEASRKGGQVRALNAPPRWLLPAIAGTVGAMAIIGGVVWWHSYEAERARLAALARTDVMRAQQAAIRQLNILESKPAAADWILACQRAVAPVPAAVGGWRLGTYGCSGASAHVEWKRGPGATPSSAPPGVLDGRTGETIGQTIALDSVPGGKNNAVPLGQAEVALYSLLMPLGAKMAVQKQAAQAPLPGTLVPAAVMPNEAFQASLPIAPFALRWGAVPGLVLDSVAVNADGSWSVMGTLYGH